MMLRANGFAVVALVNELRQGARQQQTKICSPPIRMFVIDCGMIG